MANKSILFSLLGPDEGKKPAERAENSIIKQHSLRIEGVTMLMTDSIGPMISFSLSIWISRRTKL